MSYSPVQKGHLKRSAVTLFCLISVEIKAQGNVCNIYFWSSRKSADF